MSQDDLDPYRAKRDFAHTPEPRPHRGRRRTRRTAFVVHRHEARRLHYDLRLEMDGVLKSFAVPKVFCFDPREKRLAIRTEDHPLEYLDFHGVIPQGQYGAGTMTIWDRGHYELTGPYADDGDRCLAEGKVELRIFGSRLRGDWHMVRLKGEKGNEWLLFKSKDRYARDKDDPVFALAVTDADRGPLPRFVEPMRAMAARKPFFAAEWLFELQLPGTRVQIRKDGDRVGVRDVDNDRSLTRRLAPLVEQLRRLRADRALLDGMLVSLDDDQRPAAARLDAVLAGDSAEVPFLYVFDLLYYEQWNVRRFPLTERKAGLASVLPPLDRVLYVEHERGRGEDLFATVRAAGLGGVVAKQAESAYESGKTRRWRSFRAEFKESREPPPDLFTALRGARRARRAATSRRIKFTNRQKVLWPQDGYTKGELIDYYETVHDALLPYLKQRPLSLNRFPNGIEGESFYQKNVPAHVPDWVRTVEVASRSEPKRIRYVLCDDRDTLLYLANLAAIDLHPWLSSRGSLDSPDWAVLDLDPLGCPFSQVMAVARTIGKVLRGIGLRPYLKTSGSKGLHVFLPLRAGYTFDQARMFCEGVARVVVGRHANHATIERAKGSRSGRVYIDFMQNRRGQTVVAPYVVRPVPGATVSTPLDWDELATGIDPAAFHIHSLPARLATVGDLFAATLTDRQDLGPAIDALRDQCS